MTNIVQVIYARKPCNWHEIETGSRHGSGGRPYRTEIIETREMTADEYDAFIAAPLASRDWLAGKGGFKDETTRLAIAVSAPARRILYVDPSGSDYGRYIGMDASIPYYPDVRVKLVGENGNAFNLLGICRRAAEAAGVPADEIKAFANDATSGDYNHFLGVCQRWFDCF